ncbi:hypothetical protein ACHAXN_004444 [Cyclotella atomus]
MKPNASALSHLSNSSKMITSFFPKRKREHPASESSSSKRPASACSASTVSTASSSSSAASKSNSASSSSSSASVSALLSHFPSSAEDVSWGTALKKTLESKQFENLSKFVEKERANKTVYPPPELVFSALAKTPLHKVKVVIVGQDPYHQPSQGHGLSFSVPHSVAIPPSLRNIYKELVQDSNLPEFNTKPTHGNLESWAHQGVLLLNNVLTVRRGEAGSHSKKGWEEFTDAVIRAVLERDDDSDNNNNNSKGVVFLLWGKPASTKATTVLSKYAASSKKGDVNSKHAIIMTSHPSPLGASKTSSPFLGSRCFSRCNEELRKRGWEEVDWRV